MAIDSSIYNRVQAPDIVGGVERGMRMGDMINQRRKENALSQAYNKGITQNPDGTVKYDGSKTVSEMAALGYGQEAANLQQQMQAQQREKRMKDLDLISRLTGSVKDQATYDQALKTGSAMGLDVSQMPTTYDPQLIQYYQGAALTEKERLDQDIQRAQLAKLQAETNKIRGTSSSGPTSNLNSKFGKPEPGYRWKADGSLEPIPGGPKDKVGAGPSEKRKQDASLVVQDIGRSLELIKKKPSAAGPYDLGLMSYIPGSSAQQLDSLLDSVKSNIGFDKLQAMREASPTGGALGSVSEKETAMLQATAGSLSSSMDEDMLKENLKRLYNQYNDIVHGPGKGPQRYKLSFDEQGRPVEQSIVKMRAPSGREISVPQAQVDEAQGYGATQFSQTQLRNAAQAELQRRRQARQAQNSGGGLGGS